MNSSKRLYINGTLVSQVRETLVRAALDSVNDINYLISVGMSDENANLIRKDLEKELEIRTIIKNSPLYNIMRENAD